VHITLASTINRNYWVPFEVLVASLLGNKRATTSVTWHVITDEALAWDAWIERMSTQYADAGVTFVPHRLDHGTRRPLPLRGRARPILYARLLVPDMLAAQTERVLYLDADMLVLRPIEDLWMAELGGSTCACCQDLAIPLVSSMMAIRAYEVLRLAPDTPYFNAGVMLIDTSRWCAESVGERALTYLAQHEDSVNMFDQEALNVVLASRWHRLSVRWNLIASVAGRSFLDTRPLRSDDYQASLNAPCIVHYAGTLKPWRNPYLRGRWFAPYRQTLHRVLPTHRFAPSLLDLAQAAYDASVRDWVYPLERALWQARRGF
jgi:lipopolysaccharide biosynthesis glycosyltransferase